MSTLNNILAMGGVGGMARGVPPADVTGADYLKGPLVERLVKPVQKLEVLPEKESFTERYPMASLALMKAMEYSGNDPRLLPDTPEPALATVPLYELLTQAESRSPLNVGLEALGGIGDLATMGKAAAPAVMGMVARADDAVDAAKSRKLFRAEPNGFRQGFDGGAPPGTRADQVIDFEIERGFIDADAVTPAMREQLKDMDAGDLMWVSDNQQYMLDEFGPNADWPGLITADDIQDVSQRVADEGWVELPLSNEQGQILMVRRDALGDTLDLPNSSIDTRRVLPDGEKRTLPALNDQGRIELTHFTDADGLESLDPQFYGSNSGRNQEAALKSAYPDQWQDRTYYGLSVGEPGGYNVNLDRGVGTRMQYKTSVSPDEIYDYKRDPLELYPDRMDGPDLLNRKRLEYEKRIREAGFKGYWTDSGGDRGMAAAIFEPLPVESGGPVPAGGLASPTSAPVAESVQRVPNTGSFTVGADGVLRSAPSSPVQAAPASAPAVSSGTRQYRPGELGFDQRFDPRIKEQDRLGNLTVQIEGGAPTVPTVNLADYEGRPVIFTQSDRTRAGGQLVGINDTALDQPVEFLGGQDFMHLNPGMVWASGQTPTNLLMNSALAAKKATGADPLLMPWRMAPTGGDFAHMTGETMIGFAQSNMTKRVKGRLNTQIKKIIPGWKGIDDPGAIAQYRSATDSQRKQVKQMMDVKFRDEGGLSIGEARLSVTDPRQLNAPDFGLQNVGVIDTSRPIITQSGHVTYPYGVPGEGIGKLPSGMTAEMLLPELFNDPAIQNLRRKMQLQPQATILTESLLRSLE